MTCSRLLCLALAVTGCGPTPTDLPQQKTCPVAAGPTPHHDTITSSETWTAAGSPHVVTFGITVAKGATLTIEPCAEVRFQKDYGLDVRGRLVAEGTGTQTIHFTADDASKPWSFIGVNGGTASLASVLLENGGSVNDPNGLGVIDVRGDVSSPRQQLLKVKSVAIKGSGTYGVSLRDGATFTADSSGLSVEGAQWGAVRTDLRLAGNIPPGKYTGNTVDRIVVTDAEPMSEDTIFHDRGVPYFFGETDRGNLALMKIGVDGNSPQHAVMTIEPGVTIKVGPGGRISTASNSNPPQSFGAIVAQGTPLSLVTFTSASKFPGAGDWVGLVFGVADILDHLDWVVIDDAGGPSQASGYHCPLNPLAGETEDAAVILFGVNWGPFITNTSITSSAGYGIDRAWSGGQVDFLTSNTFGGLKRCKQSYPRDEQGLCPSTVPCP